MSGTINNTYSAFMQNFRGAPVVQWMQNYLEVPVVVSALYLCLVFYVPEHIMRHRPAMELRPVIVAWNMLLSAFSIWGAIYCLPVMRDVLLRNVHLRRLLDPSERSRLHDNFYHCVCTWDPNIFFDGPIGVFTALFILSKIPEMFDTVLLVLRKKPVIFLHWYHHITVMLFCWHAYISTVSTGLMFVVMNFAVHAFMYSYYLCCMIGLRRLVRPLAPFITFLQIVQMCVGLFVNVYCLYHIYYTRRGCDANVTNVRLGLLTYASYFVLFCQFFKNSYLKRQRDKAAEVEKSSRAAQANGLGLGGLVKKNGVKGKRGVAQAKDQ